MSPNVLRVAYASDNPSHTQGLTADIMRHFIDVGLEEAEAASRSGRPRERATISILDPAGSPQWRVSSRRIVLAGIGGLGFGVVAAAFVRLMKRRART